MRFVNCSFNKEKKKMAFTVEYNDAITGSLVQNEFDSVKVILDTVKCTIDELFKAINLNLFGDSKFFNNATNYNELSKHPKFTSIVHVVNELMLVAV